MAEEEKSLSLEFPTKLNIAGHIFDIKFVTIDDIDKGAYAMWRADTREILISDNLKDSSQKWNVLIHEILHILNGEIDEVTVDFLANALYQFVITNNIKLN